MRAAIYNVSSELICFQVYRFLKAYFSVEANEITALPELVEGRVRRTWKSGT